MCAQMPKGGFEPLAGLIATHLLFAAMAVYLFWRRANDRPLWQWPVRLQRIAG